MDLQNMGILAMLSFRSKGSCSYPGWMSNSLIFSADVRLGAENASSARMRPSRVTCGLRTKDRSKMISGSGNVFLLSLSVTASLQKNGLKWGT